MKFIVSAGKNKHFSLDVKPVTNSDWLDSIFQRKKSPSPIDLLAAEMSPDGVSNIGTIEHAKGLCPGCTVNFA
jgi:hypothetical protein